MDSAKKIAVKGAGSPITDRGHTPVQSDHQRGRGASRARLEDAGAMQAPWRGPRRKFEFSTQRFYFGVDR